MVSSGGGGNRFSIEDLFFGCVIVMADVLESDSNGVVRFRIVVGLIGV